MSLTSLDEQIRSCRKCGLWREARNAVPGEGSIRAKVMLVGQNPGTEEDESGRPFVGRAGKFLDAALGRNGINREDLFITNVVKHKTPNNRLPKPDEVEACTPYLISQIALVKPEKIVLMGALAWQIPRKEGVIYLETFHPSAAMRFPKMRKKFEEDLNKLKRLL